MGYLNSGFFNLIFREAVLIKQIPEKAARSHLQDLLQLLVVLHHDDVGLAVFRYVPAGVCGVGGVDAHSKAAATGGTA